MSTAKWREGDADPAVLRAGLLGLVLALAPLTVLIQDGPSAFVFASDLPLAALLIAAAPATVRRLRRLRHPVWAIRALAVVAMVLAAALPFHPSVEGALQVFRVVGAVVVAATVAEMTERGWDVWRVVLAVAAVAQTALAVAQVVAGGAVGISWLGELADPFYPVGDVRAPSGTLIHPYVLAGHALVVAGLLALPPKGVWWAVAVAVAIAPVGFTYSRAAALGAAALVAALVIGAIRASDRARFLVPAGAITLTLAATSILGLEGWSGRVTQTTTAGTAAQLTTGRGELIGQATDLIGRSPITGVGPGRYVEALPSSAEVDGIKKPVHNLPLLVAAEGGVLAGIAAVALLLAAGRAAARQGWAALGLWLAFLPLLLLDHLAYTFPVGLVLLGVWTGTLDVSPAQWSRLLPDSGSKRLH